MAHPKMPRDEDGDPILNIATMLALVLYTGCECTYAMCAAERDGDYKTWRWFSHLLWLALAELPNEKGVTVYSGE